MHLLITNIKIHKLVENALANFDFQLEFYHVEVQV